MTGNVGQADDSQVFQKNVNFMITTVIYSEKLQNWLKLSRTGYRATLTQIVDKQDKHRLTYNDFQTNRSTQWIFQWSI